ncbi:hypothetical protein [Bacillus toyonensis]|uniref:hypothetical protein n=1 Tax=Bacillus toyonensis TaxID=155322 RepID=UPI000BF62D95|nr:hypothetical protein [Bacillus toyonensis]PGF00845.1 hypothetical protein COM61_22585 [Bacillus toyonensis]PHE47001.1 hypothetical protein COF71_13680 [Bacillus toyonensis]
MSRLSRIAAQVQYLINYESATVEDDIKDQIVELLTHEEIEHRVTYLDDEKWIVDIGSYLLN